MKNVTCRVSQQGMFLPSNDSRHPPLPPHTGVSPEGTQDGNTGCLPSSHHQSLQPPPAAYPEEAPDDKAPDTGLGELKGISKGDFTEPGLLHLSRNRKVLNSLTGRVWFSFINSHLLRCLLPGLCDKKTMNPGSSFISSEQCQA